MTEKELNLRICELSHKITKNISIVMGNCYLTKNEDDLLMEIMKLSKELFLITEKTKANTKGNKQ